MLGEHLKRHAGQGSVDWFILLDTLRAHSAERLIFNDVRTFTEANRKASGAKCATIGSRRLAAISGAPLGFRHGIDGRSIQLMKKALKTIAGVVPRAIETERSTCDRCCNAGHGRVSVLMYLNSTIGYSDVVLLP